jgi:hypothetical protein
MTDPDSITDQRARRHRRLLILVTAAMIALPLMLATLRALRIL